MNIINGKIEYVLRDEILNIFAMTYGGIPNVENKQIMICKKEMFKPNRLGPFLLDTKKSTSTYKKSQVGRKYEAQIKNDSFELRYIAFIEDQIEIKPSLEFFQELKVKGLFSLWESEAPFKYFEGNEIGYLILFRVYKLIASVEEQFLEKGRRGRNYYYGLTQAVTYEGAEPVIDDETYNGIKDQIIEIANRYKKRQDGMGTLYTVEQDQPVIGSKTPSSYVAEVKKHERDPKVVAAANKRAKGVCEWCESPAPFIKDDNEPYLEVHHIVPLGEGGADTLDNVCAVCPNCHRELHYGKDREILGEWMKERIAQKYMKRPW